jgi:hypothetical protein
MKPDMDQYSSRGRTLILPIGPKPYESFTTNPSPEYHADDVGCSAKGVFQYDLWNIETLPVRDIVVESTLL